MATRNRTEEYIQLRNMAQHNNTNSDTNSLLVDVEMSTSMKPKWVVAMEQIRELQRLIAEDHERLERTHQQRLKVQFGVDSSEQHEKEINTLMNEISRRFKTAEFQIKRMDETFKASLKNGGSDAELSILRNVKLCLVNEVAALNKRVRDSNRNYMSSLEKQRGVRDRWSEDTKAEEVEERMARNKMIDDMNERGVPQEQIEAMILNTRLTDERDMEFRRILDSIKNLREMFSDLHEMVIEQGSLLDRIDHNMTITHERIVDSKKELVKAAQYQKSGSFKLCVLLLCVLIIGFTLALLVKIIL